MKGKRRPINPEWDGVFNDIRERTAKYGDAMLRINTIEMYEGIDDKPADLIIAAKIIEELPDPLKALQEINQLALKSAIVTIKLDSKRGEKYWRKTIEHAMAVLDWVVEKDHITAVCSPGMRVQGIRPHGALTDELRWQNVQTSTKLISKRIEPKPAHDRRAVVCCYGPSLQETWPHILEETNSDIISVSGSHDFLLGKGIVPTFHVECDPRAHKTDNIKAGHPDVSYLLASNCHPSLFERLTGMNIRLWHVAISEHCMKLVDEMGERNDWIVSGGGSVGLRSLPLLHVMGYRNFSIYGMDCSFSSDGETQWAGPHAGKRQELCTIKCGDEDFITSHVLITYAANFFDIRRRMPDAHFNFYGDGLLQAMIRFYASYETKPEAA
jgi:hypothetical protein